MVRPVAGMDNLPVVGWDNLPVVGWDNLLVVEWDSLLVVEWGDNPRVVEWGGSPVAWVDQARVETGREGPAADMVRK
jgi:hypothetical protein